VKSRAQFGSIWASLLVIGLDQLSKVIVSSITSIERFGTGIYAWKNILWAGQSEVSRLSTIAVSSIVIIAIAYILLYKEKDKKAVHAAVYSIGGGASNLIDRVVHGGVIDIIHVQAVAINLADIAIIIGAIMLLWAAWNIPTRHQRQDD